MTIARIRRNGAKVYCSKGEFIRRMLPYGLWTCQDGREVLFDRDYTPICQRTPPCAPSFADPNEWVPWATQHWFYNDATPERRKKVAALASLAEWGFVEPILAQAEEMASRSPSRPCV